MAIINPIEFLIANDLAEAVIIIGLAFILAKLTSLFMKKIVFSFTQMTKTSLDDDIVTAVRRPVFFGILVIGLFYAFKSISYLEKHVPSLTKGVTIIGIALIFFMVRGVVDSIIKWYATELSPKIKNQTESKHLTIFKRVADIILLFIFLLVILNYLGIDITPFVASLGIGGLAVALAMQETLSNFIAGLSIISDKSLKIGDYIELENGLGGYIDDISWRTSRIRTLGNDYVIVPNNKLSQSIATDYNFGNPETFVSIDLAVSYKSDLDKVEKITKKVAEEVENTIEGGVKGYKPNARFKKFGDSNIEFSVALKVSKFSDQYLIKHEFIKKIKKAFDKNRIEISRPTRYVYIKK